MKFLLTAAAALAIGLASSQAQATVVTSIKITSPISNYLQIAELQAFQAGTGTDVALAGTATSSSVYGVSYPAFAIDGNTGGNFYTDGIFHSTGGPDDYLLVTLAQAYDLSSLVIFGRSDCCSDRDHYTYTLFNGVSAVGSGTLDADNAAHSATAVFDTGAPGVPGVPEPATWAMMVIGFGGLGGILRRRRAQQAVVVA